MHDESKNVHETDNYTPFAKNVKQRDYTKVVTDGNITDIPEAIFTPPSMDELRAGVQEKLGNDEFSKESKSVNQEPGQTGSNPSATSTGHNQQTPTKERFNANPALNDLDDSEKHKAAVTLVDAALDGYERLNKLGANLIKFPMRKIKKMERAKEIDTSIPIPLQEGPVPMQVFMETYNESVSDIFEVSDEFKKKVKPVAVRLAKKYNFGMSDEALLAYYVGVDLTAKIAIGYQLHAQMKDMLEDFKDMTVAYNKQSPAGSGQNNPGFNTETKNPTPNQPEPQPDAKQNDEPEKKRERDFFEPEEINNQPPANKFSEPINVTNVNNSDPSKNVEIPDKIIPPKVKSRKNSMPEFGDKSLLNDMENLANRGKRKRK